MPKITIDRERCKGCEFCIAFCPKKAIKMGADFNAAGYHPAVFIDERECTGCGFCYQVCPEVAIEVYK